MTFYDRAEAGQRLAALLGAYANRADVLVLGLPRGGVPVAYEVARALSAPLDIIVARKLGVPYERELAMGAIASGGVRVLNADIISELGIAPEVVDAVTEDERRELVRRERLYRGERPQPDCHQRIVILVDDGIATGATMRAAIASVRQQQPTRIVVAIPVAAASTLDELRKEVDEVVCAIAPDELYGVGMWYRLFPPVSDESLHALLMRAWNTDGAQPNEPREPYNPLRT